MDDNQLMKIVRRKLDNIEIEKKNLIEKIDIIFLYSYITDNDYKKLKDDMINKIIEEVLWNSNLIPISSTYGLCKLGYALDILSKYDNKYYIYKSRIDKIIKWRVGRIITEVKGKKTISLFYDSVNGLSGVCRYMLCDIDYFYKEIISINNYFTDLTLKTTRDYKDNFFISKNGMKCIDLGMAHGVAGPLFVLSLSMNSGVKIESKDAINSLMKIYMKNIYFYNNKYNLNPYDNKVEQKIFLRKNSWCYGLNGISQAIKIGANIRGDEKSIKLSKNINKQCMDIDNLKIKYKEKTFCHGLSGIFHFISKFTVDNREKKTILDSVEKDLINEIIQNDKEELSILDGYCSILIPILIRNSKINIDNDIFSKIFMLE